MVLRGVEREDVIVVRLIRRKSEVRVRQGEVTTRMISGC